MFKFYSLEHEGHYKEEPEPIYGHRSDKREHSIDNASTMPQGQQENVVDH